jgi:hypothetical protein
VAVTTERCPTIESPIPIQRQATNRDRQMNIFSFMKILKFWKERRSVVGAVTPTFDLEIIKRLDRELSIKSQSSLDLIQFRSVNYSNLQING